MKSILTDIPPTKEEYLELRSVCEKLRPICKGKCDLCFMNSRLGGESCCPIEHLVSITQNMTDELIKLALEALPKVDK